MKKQILFAGLIGVVGISMVVGGWNFFSTEKQYYQPRETVSTYSDAAHGSAQWIHKMRANQITGEVDEQDVMAARQQLNLLKAKNKTSAKQFDWEEMGPDNIGGRTRAILFDKDNPDIMYAGAVSGGLFRSPNGGRSWQKVSDQQENLAVVSICQAVDGTIYYGTGEGMYYGATGTGTGGILGGGIFKSTDPSGTSFQQLTNTIPAGTNGDWASVGKMVADPSNASIIYAATNRGIKKTTDGGDNWTTISIMDGSINLSTSSVTDMIITPSGTIWAKVSSYIFKSTDGTNFTEVSVGNAGPTDLPRNGGRTRIAVAPQDENYVYAVSTTAGGFFSQGGDFISAYQSTDGGNTWRVIGSNNAFLNPHNGQGDYNHALAVSPIDKERIFVGGVTFWEWSEDNGWLQVSSLAGIPGSQIYVHADNHAIVFHPDKPQTIWIGNDGGLFKSTNDGFTWSWEVKNYITTQFYNIAVGLGEEMMGGTQDNGTILVNPNGGLFPKNGFRVPGINYKGEIRDGDGGYAALSRLDPTVRFKEMQYGVMGRSIDGGDSYNDFFDFDRMDPNDISQNLTASFADFVAPFLLWEKLNDPNSEDSVKFIADSAFISLGFGNGGQTYSGTLRRPQASSTYLPDGLKVSAGSQVITSDGSGNLVGDGTGTFNDTTGEFSVTFNNSVVLEISAKCAVSYDANDVIEVSSNTNDIPISYTLNNDLNPMDSIVIQDPVQAMFFAGLRSSNIGTTTNERGGIWMCRNILSDKTATPEWFHIGELGGSVTPQCMAVSDDGDMLYVGTNAGRVYRFSNLNAARDSASADVDDLYDRNNFVRANTSVIQDLLVGTYGGRAITSISIHPDDKNKAIITVGNYGNNNYVYYSNNAAQALPTFTPVQGDLPDFPVYSSTFDYTAPNDTRVLVGTDYGVFVTDDVTAGSVTWEQTNTGLANVPVFSMIQPKTVRYDLKDPSDFEGAIYAGTHGRGIFKTTSSFRYIGIDENNVVDKEVSTTDLGLNIFPNPAIDNVNISIALEGRQDVMISVRDISGKVVKSVNYSDINQDVKQLPLSVSSLAKGTYIITLQYGKTVKTGKLVKG